MEKIIQNWLLTESDKINDGQVLTDAIQVKTLKERESHKRLPLWLYPKHISGYDINSKDSYTRKVLASFLLEYRSQVKLENSQSRTYGIRESHDRINYRLNTLFPIWYSQKLDKLENSESNLESYLLAEKKTLSLLNTYRKKRQSDNQIVSEKVTTEYMEKFDKVYTNLVKTDYQKGIEREKEKESQVFKSFLPVKTCEGILIGFLEKVMMGKDIISERFVTEIPIQL